MRKTTESVTKAMALRAYEGNASALARALDISPQAVYQWSDKDPIPEVHALRLRFVLRPDIDWTGSDSIGAHQG